MCATSGRDRVAVGSPVRSGVPSSVIEEKLQLRAR